MKGIKRTTIGYEMRKYCKPSSTAIDLMHKVVLDFIKESCARSNSKLLIKRKVVVSEKILSDSIGLK